MLHPERDDEVRDLALVVPRAEVLVRRVRASSFSYGPVLRRLSALASPLLPLSLTGGRHRGRGGYGRLTCERQRGGMWACAGRRRGGAARRGWIICWRNLCMPTCAALSRGAPTL